MALQAKVLISELPNETADDLSDAIFPVSRGGMTRKVTGETLADFINGKLADKDIAIGAVANLFGVDADGDILKLPAAFTPNVSSTTWFGMKDAGGFSFTKIIR